MVKNYVILILIDSVYVVFVFNLVSSGARCFYLVIFNPQEEPKKVRFDYDLFLHLEGHPPVNHLRCEKLTFNNPTEEFRRKLLKAGGVSLAPMSKAITTKILLLVAGA